LHEAKIPIPLRWMHLLRERALKFYARENWYGMTRPPPALVRASHVSSYYYGPVYLVKNPDRRKT